MASSQKAVSGKRKHILMEEKQQSQIHSMAGHGEVASCDIPAAEEFATIFYKLVQTEGYLPQQVFNCNETGLFWKRMPKRILVAEEATSDYKPCEDHLTLLFAANASGDLKINPLLACTLLYPRACRKRKVNKDDMGVFWRATKNAQITQPIFVTWVNLVFGPTVHRYLEESNLPLKAVLLLNNAPAHSPGFEKDLRPEYSFIKILFLPPNTPILQPMDQQVILNFKKLYTRELFRRCVLIRECCRLTIQEFWRDHFDIVDSLKMIRRAWDGVSQHNLVAAWHPLWPDSSQPFEVEAAPPPQPDNAVVSEIVDLGRSIELEVSEDDVVELVESHKEDEFVDSSSNGKEGARSLSEVTTSWLRNILQAHEIFQQALPYLPCKTVATRFLTLDATVFIPAVTNELKKRQKQQSLERQKSDNEQPSCSTAVELSSPSN